MDIPIAYVCYKFKIKFQMINSQFFSNSDPITIKSRPWYQLIFIFTSVTMFIASSMICMMFAVFLGLSIFVAQFFRHLQSQISELDDTTNFCEYKEKIVNCIKYHNQILSWVDDIENIISLIFLGQFLVTGIIICTLMYQLSMVGGY